MVRQHEALEPGNVVKVGVEPSGFPGGREREALLPLGLPEEPQFDCTCVPRQRSLRSPAAPCAYLRQKETRNIQWLRPRPPSRTVNLWSNCLTAAQAEAEQGTYGAQFLALCQGLAASLVTKHGQMVPASLGAVKQDEGAGDGGPEHDGPVEARKRRKPADSPDDAFHWCVRFVLLILSGHEECRETRGTV